MRSLILALALLTTGAAYANPPVQPVEHVDLERYAGRWYEIARLPMFFQRQCVADTTAEYTRQADGSVGVTNRCRTKSGNIDVASGNATVVEGSGNAKLEVTFVRPFKGDYWVIGLDPDYRWAVVGSPSRKTLWVLSRTAQMDPAELQHALDIARDQGYDLNDLIYTEQH